MRLLRTIFTTSTCAALCVGGLVGSALPAAATGVADVLIEPELILDINTTSDGSNPNGFVSIGAVTYFQATTGAHGGELWKHDEQSGETDMVIDLRPGPQWSGARPIGEIGDGKLIFSAFRPDVGRELFGTRGTAETTELLADMKPGTPSSSPNDFTEFLDGWVFLARDGDDSQELWRIDGGGDVEQLTSINPDDGSSVSAPTVVEEAKAVFFTATDEGGIRQLYRWDEATGAVAIDPPPGATSWLPNRMANFNGVLALTARVDGSSDSSLFFVDGDSAATMTVTDAGLSGNVASVDSSNGRLFVQVFAGGSPTIVRYTSPAIAPKTVLVGVIMREQVPFGSGLIFQGQNVDGSELWMTDGTASGTLQIADLRPGSDSSSPRDFAIDHSGDVATFRAIGTDGTLQMWWTNGEEGNVRSVPTSAPGTPGSALHQTTAGSWLFGFGDTSHELWVSDLLDSAQLADLNTTTQSSYPHAFAEFDGLVYFLADDDVHGREVWAYDPAGGPATRLTSFAFTPRRLTATDTHVFFSNDDHELWAMSGGSAGFGFVTAFDEPVSRLDANGSKVFIRIDAPFGDSAHLWASDGSIGGTVDLGVFEDVRSLRPFGDKILFWPDVDATGHEPWVSDGTVAGTFALGDLQPGPSRSYAPHVVTTPAGVGYFVAADALWSTDGTSAGTQVVPTVNIDELEDVVLHGDALLAIGVDTDDDGDEFETLWHIATPGAAPTKLDTSIDFVEEFDPRYALRFGTTTLIPYEDGNVGTAGLFAVDGATIQHISFGGTDHEVDGAAVIDGRAVLVFKDEDTDESTIWTSDGTEDGTVRVTDPIAGDVSTPVFIGSRAYLEFPSTVVGYEPHFFELAETESEPEPEPEVGDGFVPLQPGRLLDTRAGQDTVDGMFAGTGRVPADDVVELLVAGRGGVPDGARAVSLNVTMVRPDGPGFATLWPCGEDQPTASNINFVGGDVVPNAVLSKLSDQGTVCIFTNRAADIIVDANGAFMGASGFDPVVPGRVLDTRPGQETIDGRFAAEGRVAAGEVLELPVGGRADVAADAVAVSLNVTMVRPDGPGFATVWPCGAEQPESSNVNFVGGDVVPNAVLSKTSDEGKVCIFTNRSADIIVDVNGSFAAGSQYSPLVPGRLLDTRPGQETIDGEFAGGGVVPAGQVVVLDVAGRSSVPSDAAAVSMNVTVVRPAGPGFSTVWPCDEVQPEASNINFAGGDVVPNAVLSKLSADGTVCIFTNQAAHVLVDVNGAFT